MKRSVSILVPHAPAGAERENSWAWNERRWRLTCPEAELVVGQLDGFADPGRFCRARALNLAAAQATGEVFVIADADTACGPEWLALAVSLARDRWVLPSEYVRLDAHTSALWLSMPPVSPPPPGWQRGIEETWPFNVSGIVVVPRTGFEAVGGFDERFVGWGGEDEAFACAISTLWAPSLRLSGHTAWHLWHPRPGEHSFLQPNYQESIALAKRYAEASGHPKTIRRILAER